MQAAVESAVGLAFLMGVVSAISLPLGSLTAARFRFTDRSVSFLMAFGGGALLAALTLDLVAEGIEKGHYLPLALGWLSGGILFIVLNNAVNDLGGFRRKISTAVYQSRRQERRRFRRFISGVQYMDIFAELKGRDYEALRASIKQQVYPKGAYLFREEDPSDFLYLIESGDVDLINPDAPPKEDRKDAGRRDVIGRLAFLTGVPSALNAMALTDCAVLKLPREAFLNLLPNSPELIQSVHRWLRGPDVKRYLVTLHDLEEEVVEDWISNACRELYKTGKIPDVMFVDRHREEFLAGADCVEAYPLFAGLPQAEREDLASLLVHKFRKKGHTFFFNGEYSDRMYFIDDGEVALYDYDQKVRTPEYLGPDRTFGATSFLAGGRHSMSAVATTDTSVWVLRRSDLDALLTQAPVLAERLRALIRGQMMQDYLTQRQRLSPANASKWSDVASKAMKRHEPLPAAGSFAMDLPDQHGAPIAIWLGILLDGIPEGLVIGASMVSSHLSLSLIAGLFISNYPEALSSSAGMREQGFSWFRIHVMWGSLVLITGLLAAIGNLFFVDASPQVFTYIQGLAAGAMLTMISQTMLPEAYFRGGSIIGMASLLGFLAAILLKAVE